MINEVDILDDDEDSDEEILEEFEKMLDTEEKPDTEERPEPKEEGKPEDIEESTKRYLEQYIKKERIRDGLPAELPIYFKMRAKFYYRVKVQV